MNELFAFAAALLALRLTGAVARRWRARRTPDLGAWAAGLGAYAFACGALAWAAAAGWDDRVFRTYYLFGGLLSAPLLGAGSLARVGLRWAAPLALIWVGLAIGVMFAEPLAHPVSGTAIPAAQDHLDWFPARALALAGNTAGTIAIVVVAVTTFRRRPFNNLLLLLGIAVAAAGSALVGLGEAGTAAFFAVAVVLLYAGFMIQSPQGLLTLRRGNRLTR
jgi:hypothetical protein